MITELDTQIELFQKQFEAVKKEVSKVIVGYPEIIDGILMGLLARGHVLLEGVPGLGKTKLVQTLSEALHLRFPASSLRPTSCPPTSLEPTWCSRTRTARSSCGSSGVLFLET
jgi:MoxR-like ATPase